MTVWISHFLFIQVYLVIDQTCFDLSLELAVHTQWIFFSLLSTVNIDGKIGAVGFVSVLFPSVYPVALLKVDEETREIVRDSNGMCIRCKPG